MSAEAANIFNTVPLTQPTETRPGHLSKQQLSSFFTDGFLVLEDFFDVDADLQPCRDAIEVLVDKLANRLYEGGKIKNLYKELDLFHRLTAIEREFEGATVLLHKAGILPEAFQKLWCHAKLLNMLEQLVGPNIAGNSVWNIRPKTPKAETGVVPWHQDNSYLDENANDILIVTAWIPLIDANEENGCLQVHAHVLESINELIFAVAQVMRGGQRRGKLVNHHGCWGNTWYLEMDETAVERDLGIMSRAVKERSVKLPDDIVTLPVKYGGLVLFTNMLPHRSLENRSSNIRWSLDLRWQDSTKPDGYYGLKECITMRLRDEPHLKPDWETFCKFDRQHKQEEVKGAENVQKDPFDTVLIGPWITRWPITHENKHTRRMKELLENNRPYFQTGELAP